MPVSQRTSLLKSLTLSCIGHATLFALILIFSKDVAPTTKPAPVQVYLQYEAQPESPTIQPAEPPAIPADPVGPPRRPPETPITPTQTAATEQAPAAQQPEVPIDWWQAGSDAAKAITAQNTEPVRQFGSFPRVAREHSRQGEGSVPNIFKATGTRKGTVTRNAAGGIIYWVSDKCFVTVEFTTLGLQAADLLPIAKFACGWKSTPSRTDFFETLVREKPAGRIN